jgi:CheY-like chemotaxis protein
VADNGSGIDRETLDHIFEPFFTTKPQGQGTGLGLATVYGIVKQNQGFIVVDSGPDRGTTFCIHFPREEEPAPPSVQACDEKTVETGQGTILLVEDEPSMLYMVKTMLEIMGYKVLAAASPSEAIRLAREHEKEIHVLMTDVIMPEMNGPELADRLMTENPGLKQIFMSGYTANLIARHGVLVDGVQFLQKPFMKKDLAEKMRLVFQDDQGPKR